jgi:hypothetical protein
VSAEILATLLRISDQLAAAGVPPISDYWRGEADRFYLHPTARLLVECVGRGGDKSRNSTIDAIAEVLAGDFRIPLGERHYFTHISENRDEAAKTLAILESYLRILRVPFARSGDTIELTAMPRGFKVLAARVGAVSGWRCIGWTADEAAKWDDDGADPSAEVIASIKAMSVTHPGARGRMISSPLAKVGHFYEIWSQGDTGDQIAGQAPSWIANPSITEEQTHKLERDPKKHAREYGAIPADATEDALFEAALIDRARRAVPGDIPPMRGVRYFGAMDPGLTTNRWTFCIACLRIVDGRRKASIVVNKQWTPPRGGSLDPAGVLQGIDQYARPYGVLSVWTDQYHAESLAVIASRLSLGFGLFIDKMTAAEKLTRYEGVLTRLLDDEIDLPHDPQLRADLLAVRRVISRGNSRWTIDFAQDSSGRHADYAPSVVLCLSQIARITHEAEAREARWRDLERQLEALSEHSNPENRLEEGRERMRLARRIANSAERRVANDRAWNDQLRKNGSPAAMSDEQLNEMFRQKGWLQ